MDLTTLGVKFGWAVETTAGQKPTAFTQIPNCKKIGGISLESDSIDTTPLEASVKRYAKGLQDTGGKWPITFGLNDTFVDNWGALQSASDTAKSSGLSTWFVVWIPDMTDSFYVIAEAGSIPMPDIDVSNALEVQTSNVINDYKGLLAEIEPT